MSSSKDECQQSVYFVSDRTAITAETLGQSLLAQFDVSRLHEVTVPFVDTPEKADALVKQINEARTESALAPIIFSTLADPKTRDRLRHADGILLDLFDGFLEPLERCFNTKASTKPWAHRVKDPSGYENRIDAIEYSLQHDDGALVEHYDKADLIMIGVSRTGKTPTCLYLAMQFGIRAANYPITEDDLGSTRLPNPLTPYQPRLFGLTIDPSRLQSIRQERRRGSQYASLAQCRRETRAVESLLRSHVIPFINTSNLSVEEIATRVLEATGLKRHAL